MVFIVVMKKDKFLTLVWSELVFFIKIYYGKQDKIKLFNDKRVRTHRDNNAEKWCFSIVDIVGVLTDSSNPRKYWSILKTRLKKEGSELTTNCSQLKMEVTDGKRCLTDVADTETLLRLVQSIQIWVQKHFLKIK